MKLSRIPDHRLLQLTIAIWAIAYLGLCARPLFKIEKSSVYPDFSSAGDHWLNSELLYQRGGKNEFRYSPLIAAFFVPFDLLPARIGEFLWRSLNFIAFIGGLYYCCRAGLPRPFSVAQSCAVFLLCIPLALGSLNNAQSNPLVLGLLLIAAAAVVRKRWTLSCIAITLATCFKLYPIAFGLLVVAMYPWRMGWRLFVCITAAAVLPFVLQRAGYVMDQYTIWVNYLSSEDRQFGPMTDWYRDFRSLWRVYIGSTRQSTYLLIEISSAALIAMTCLIARFRRMPTELLIAFTLSLACCWMTVLGPATESPTYILIAPAIAWGIVMAEVNAQTPVFVFDPEAQTRREGTPEDLDRARDGSGSSGVPSDTGLRMWIAGSGLSRIGYAIVFGLFIASQLALNIGPRGKFFRDHLQPLPLAGLLLMILVWGQMLGIGKMQNAD